MHAESALDIEPLRRALVIDDEDAVRGVLHRWLRRRGWEVTEAADGEAARTWLDASIGDQDRPAYDLVICDLRMPSIGGEELHAWMAVHTPNLLPRLLFASGDVREPSAVAFLHDSGCPVLEKPFEFHRLESTIASVLAGASATDNSYRRPPPFP